MPASTLVRIRTDHAEWIYKNLFGNSSNYIEAEKAELRIKHARLRHERWNKNEPSGWIVHVSGKLAGYIGFGRVYGKDLHIEVGYCFVEDTWEKVLDQNLLLCRYNRLWD